MKSQLIKSQLIVIGTSLGGLAALRVLLQGLKPGFSIPIAVVQHRHKDSDSDLIDYFQQYTTLIVREVEDKDPIEWGYVYFAPPDYHLLVEVDYFVLSTDEPVSYARPSIDVLFESAADAYGERTIGVILTGANQDGAAGAAAVKASGGRLIVQHPDSAESPVMPTAAIARARADWILPLNKIADRLNQL
jgi:two-component system, chemotaxis family, protein-glutamate methylesterase/glutaminase